MESAQIIFLLILGYFTIEHECQTSRCNKTNIPRNGKVNCVEDGKGNLKCYATCNRGFTFQTTSVEFRSCNQIDGSWESGNIFPDCIDTFLMKHCRPAAAPAHGTVTCAYSATDLTCTAKCNTGFSFLGLPAKSQLSLKCTTSNTWSDGDRFQDCVAGDRQTGPETHVSPRPPIFTGKCIDQLSVCPAEGDFTACTACNQFVTCAPDGIFLTTCPPPTVWDDNKKQCSMVSSTCS
ncbi:uncharacterized protein LOC134723784 [Mytilus trossulus]|uniref:uncharacterized protein LOC134723784 n=1 Tax=Mytilus trossulus TaxID=6551 RepID=UPI003006A5EA